MSVKFVLTEYIDRLMAGAIYDKLEDRTFSGKIPECKGVISFGATLRECEDELRSTLEDWILVGLRLGHDLPIIAGIDTISEVLGYDLLGGCAAETAGPMLFCVDDTKLSPDDVISTFEKVQVPIWKIGTYSKGKGLVSIQKNPKLIHVEKIN